MLASTLSFALKYPQEAIAKKWLKDISPSLTNCVVPGYEYLDLNQQNSLVNALLLHELIDRTSSGRDLLYGIDDFIEKAIESVSSVCNVISRGQII